ncbi:hypothetical protein L2E82_30342 [Cichorium intybus]|uniref:Uncharacterized protein n=1 Tax=Cichorium intybus TaxID=13427 RepID=A0ACB9D002_CICIN|nr:hypothetical protein L2E82_30342 [Cichorium intybus]
MQNLKYPCHCHNPVDSLVVQTKWGQGEHKSGTEWMAGNPDSRSTPAWYAKPTGRVPVSSKYRAVSSACRAPCSNPSCSSAGISSVNQSLALGQHAVLEISAGVDAKLWELALAVAVAVGLAVAVGQAEHPCHDPLQQGHLPE